MSILTRSAHAMAVVIWFSALLVIASARRWFKGYPFNGSLILGLEESQAIVDGYLKKRAMSPWIEMRNVTNERLALLREDRDKVRRASTRDDVEVRLGDMVMRPGDVRIVMLSKCLDAQIERLEGTLPRIEEEMSRVSRHFERAGGKG